MQLAGLENNFSLVLLSYRFIYKYNTFLKFRSYAFFSVLKAGSDKALHFKIILLHVTKHLTLNDCFTSIELRT
jgi:hypothetical protein